MATEQTYENGMAMLPLVGPQHFFDIKCLKSYTFFAIILLNIKKEHDGFQPKI
jgi:hypothetical protein